VTTADRAKIRRLKLLLLQIAILQLAAGCGASAPPAAPPLQIDAAAKVAVVQAVSDGSRVEFALAGPLVLSVTDPGEPIDENTQAVPSNTDTFLQ
jgi:hypothetical protein